MLGVVGIVRISLWQYLGFYDYGEHWMLIALTVGAALIGIVMFGSVTGSMVPFILQWIGFDPASASAPFVATLVDVTGCQRFLKFFGKLKWALEAALTHDKAWSRASRPKRCKLATNAWLRQAVASKLRLNWAPEQIAGWLKRAHPEGESGPHGYKRRLPKLTDIVAKVENRTTL